MDFKVTGLTVGQLGWKAFSKSESLLKKCDSQSLAVSNDAILMLIYYDKNMT